MAELYEITITICPKYLLCMCMRARAYARICVYVRVCVRASLLVYVLESLHLGAMESSVILASISLSYLLVLMFAKMIFFGLGNPRGGGGGTLFFSAYVGSDLASTVHPKKISEI